MNPSINGRLDSMIRAMTDTVIPAVAAAGGLAIEQAQLVLGHLHVLRMQQEFAADYERSELHQMRALAQTVLTQAAGGPRTQDAVARLTHAMSETGHGNRSTPERRDDVGDGISRVVQALGSDGTPPARANVAAAVLRHGAKAAERDRAWYAATGFEAGDTTLPAIPELMASLRTEMRDGMCE